MPQTGPRDSLRMVDVGAKPTTRREARATAILRATAATVEAILQGRLPKGDAVATARVAGVMAAKRTADLLPLCHPLPLDAIEVVVRAESSTTILVEAVVRATARTGVEMEALVAAATAALTLYDMAKSLEPGLCVERIRLEEKTGGKGGDYRRSGPGEASEGSSPD
jgi:cyclic pyranopterin phosphate synthase